jgi:hypothetical protein
MSEAKAFDFQKFIDDSKQALLNPKDFFSKLELTGGFVEPLVKATIYGVIAGVLNMIWSFLLVGQAFGGIFGGTAGIGALFLTIIGAIIGSFIAGVIILVLSSISNGHTDFEACYKVGVGLMVVFPISALLNVLVGISFWVNTIASIALNLYALYMLYFAITESLKAKAETAKILTYVLGGLLIMFLLIGAAARKVAKSLGNYGSKYMEKELEKYKTEAEKLAKEAAKYEEEYEQLEREDKFSSTSGKNTKPERFPEQAAEQAKDWLSKGSNQLSNDKINKVIKATHAIKGMDSSQASDIYKVLQTFGYTEVEAYYRDILQATMAFEGLKGLVAMQAIIDAADDEKKAAKMFTFDLALESMVKQTAGTANLTIEDMRTTYNNWDSFASLFEK